MSHHQPRTDIHRPSAPEFDPEAYAFFGCFDLNPEWGDNGARIQLVNALLKEGYSFRGAPHGSGQCSHCGAHIRYAALMGHEPTKTLLYVGETCLDNRFEMTKAEFDRLRKAASLNRERTAKRDRIAALLAEHPVLVWASYAHNIASAGAEVYWTAGWDGETEFATEAEAAAEIATYAAHVQEWCQPIMNYKRGTTFGERARQTRSLDTLADIWYRVERYGEVSENQVAYVERLLGWIEEAAERLAQREAETAAKVEAGVQVPTGRMVVEGTVVSIKSVESNFGYHNTTTWKMLVVTEAGWKVYGTIPSSILMDTEKGTKVRFTATLEPSKDDALFGFFSRPAKAEVI